MPTARKISLTFAASLSDSRRNIRWSSARLYAEQDEIDAQIAEEEVKLVPDDEEIKKKAEELRRRAEESAARAADEAERKLGKWQPTAEAKKAYHDLARVIHPDLAIDAVEKEKRHVLMAKLNEAYKAGDRSAMSRMTDEMRTSADMVSGDSVGDNLVRAIRQIYQMNARFTEIGREIKEAEKSELFELMGKVDAESEKGRDLLNHMASRTKTHIQKSERRLSTLRELNAAQEEYVKDRFGMDISGFRKEKK